MSTSIRENEMRRRNKLAETAVKSTRTQVGVNHVQRLVRTAERIKKPNYVATCCRSKKEQQTNRLKTILQRRIDLDRKTSAKFTTKQLSTRHPTILTDTRLPSATK